MLTFCPAVADPTVTAPVPDFKIPSNPTVNARFVPPPCKFTAAPDVKINPNNDRSAFKFTVCAVVSDVALNVAVSAAPGIAPGVVPPPTTVDQFAAPPQSFAVPPELSHHNGAAFTATGQAAINGATRAARRKGIQRFKAERFIYWTGGSGLGRKEKSNEKSADFIRQRGAPRLKSVIQRRSYPFPPHTVKPTLQTFINLFTNRSAPRH